MSVFVQASAVIASSLISAGIFAQSLNCQPIVWGPTQYQGGHFNFTLRNECTLSSDKDIDFASVRELHEQYLRNSSQRFSIHSTLPSRNHGEMVGSELTVHENRLTQHGRMGIDGRILLVDDGQKHFTFNYTSQHIDGQDNAKYTVYEQFIMDIATIAPRSYRIIFSQDNTIRKPALLPKGMFESPAKKGIAAELGPRRLEHVKILTGK